MKVALRNRGKRRIAEIHFPTYCGAVRVTGVGDFFTDALGAAVKVASRITDDPIMMAIMPPQATVAIEAVRAIAAAAHTGPQGLAEALHQYSGPGQLRLIAALSKENGLPATAKAAAKAATTTDGKSSATASADNTYRGVGPVPSSVGSLRLGASIPPPRSKSVRVTNTQAGGGRGVPTYSPQITRRTPGGSSVTEHRQSAMDAYNKGDERQNAAYLKSISDWGSKDATDAARARLVDNEGADFVRPDTNANPDNSALPPAGPDNGTDEYGNPLDQYGNPLDQYGNPMPPMPYGGGYGGGGYGYPGGGFPDNTDPYAGYYPDPYASYYADDGEYPDPDEDSSSWYASQENEAAALDNIVEDTAIVRDHRGE